MTDYGILQLLRGKRSLGKLIIGKNYGLRSGIAGFALHIPCGRLAGKDDRPGQTPFRKIQIGSPFRFLEWFDSYFCKA